MTPADRHLAEAHGPVLTSGDLITAEAEHAVLCGPRLDDTLKRLAAEVTAAEYLARDCGLMSDLVVSELISAAAHLGAAARAAM